MTGGSPRFSVVIPTYDRVDLLRRTLDSVFAQEYTDFEVIVVDDGSRDATSELLRELGDRVRGLRQENQGPSAARNLGIAQARGEYVCTLDSDDLWFPWTLLTLARAIEAAGGAPALIAGALLPFQVESELAGVRPAEPEVEVYPDYLSSSRQGFFVGSGMAVYSRAALVRRGGFDPGMVNMEDHDLALRLGIEPGFAKVHAPATVAYRKHAGSIQSLARQAEGLTSCLAHERGGRYPGGRARSGDRRRLLSLHARALALACLRGGRADLGWRIYAGTFGWQLRERRLRFLLGFPLVDLGARAVRARQAG